MLKERAPCIPASETHLLMMAGKMEQKFGEGGNGAAVDVPSTIELTDDAGRSRLPRANEQDWTPCREKAVDLTRHNRPATDVPLRYQPDITGGQAFAQTGPFNIRANLDRA